MKRIQSLFIAVIALTIVACVPARKYEEIQAKEKQCAEDLAKYKDAAESAENKFKDLETELVQLKKDNATMASDSASLGDRFRRLDRTYKSLSDAYDKLQSINDRLTQNAESNSARLSDELKEREAELRRNEDRLRDMEQEIKATEARLNQTKLDLDKQQKDLASKEQRIDELESLLKKKDETVNALKDKVAKALLGFKDKGLTVEEKNGKVYVKMEAKLLFATGSTKVGPEGKKALIQLAKALQDQKDMEVLVEGHTDSDKLNSSNFPHNNWELSVLRATSVVEIMLANSSISPVILTAAGRSEFIPVGSDKAKNRRIEVILTPNLDELYKLLNNDQ